MIQHIHMIKRDLAVNQMRRAFPSLVQAATRFEAKTSDGIFHWMNKSNADENLISALFLSYPIASASLPSVQLAISCFIGILPFTQSVITNVLSAAQSTNSRQTVSTSNCSLFADVSGPDLVIRVDFT